EPAPPAPPRADPPPPADAPAAPVAPAAPATPVVTPAAPAVAPAGLVVDAATGRATYQGRGLDLTPQELILLTTLLETGRRVRSKADLVLALRGHGYVTSHFVNEADKRAVDAHVTSLRRKLGDDGPSPRVIETVRGVGYRIAPA
ncbi:winged helix-turn-helix domain-containing protein, partial [Nocardioides sp. SYSU D00038]|uniref:winged helix-turn-helix domain-containing protein n=1 Tax=Nocardioides sp. SYSU D00038 TaxID=2812554 RepID=UPI001967D3EB